MLAIKTENLTKKYNDTLAVDKLNLEIKQGELFGLLGVNGAGKTTTVKMLCGISKPTAGTATVLGFDLSKDLSEIKKKIAVSPQETAVANNLTVKENLEFICSLHSFTKQKTAQKLKELTKKLSLNNVLNKKAATLSGGYARRLSIALSLIGEPEILFLDEPTLGLDVIARSELWQIIKSLKNKTTIILTTHYMEEAEQLCDRLCIMKNGKVLMCDTVKNIIAQSGKTNLSEAFIEAVKEEI